MIPTTMFDWSRRACAGLALVAGLTLAGGAEASTEWRGGGFVSDFQGCEDDWQDGYSEAIRARYRPSGLPGNSNFSRLTLLFNMGTENYRTRQGRFTSRFRAVDGTAIWSSAWVLEPDPQLRMETHEPRSISVDTNTIRLAGMIRNFNGLSGCNMRFELMLTRRS